MSGGEYVVRTSRASNVNIYHSNPERCWNLPEEGCRRYVDREHIERRGLDECRVCAQTRSQKPQRRSFRNQLNNGEIDL